jgi:hypothetical protein
MFYQVDETYSYIRIFGFKNGQNYEIDPHEVFRVRTIGFDNIHRGVIGAAASESNRYAFCKQLFTRFKDFESLSILNEYYPNFVTDPYKRYQQMLFNCSG